MDSFVTQSIIHVHNIIILHLFLDFVSKWLFCFHNVYTCIKVSAS